MQKSGLHYESGEKRKAGSFVPEVVTKSLAEGTLPKPPRRQAEKRTM